MFEVVAQWPNAVAVWIMYEIASQLVSHPIDAETKEPIRPPISVLDYLLYNPGPIRKR
jgi:hypothetical protein